MNEEHDHDLPAIFAQQRREDREHAPAWRPELLNRPVSRQRGAIRWRPIAFATACVAITAVLVMRSPKPAPQLSELPPLFDAPPGELFASTHPPLLAFEAPSDFLLSDHLNHHIP